MAAFVEREVIFSRVGWGVETRLKWQIPRIFFLCCRKKTVAVAVDQTSSPADLNLLAAVATGTGRSVCTQHETYAESPGTYKTMYVNKPLLCLGKAKLLQPTAVVRHSAASRLGAAKRQGLTLRARSI